jgi:GTPase
VAYLRDTFRTMWHVPIAFVTAKTGKNVKALLNHAQNLYAQARGRVPTAQVNKLVRAALEHNPPPLVGNREPKIYYATQVAIQPPTIVLFCNDPRLLSKPYQRYLLGVFRDRLPFKEVPIKLYLRQRESAEKTGQVDAEIEDK